MSRSLDGHSPRDRIRAVLVVAIGLAAAGALLPAAARAQLSPGALSRAHAELEGSTNCLSCHQAKSGVEPTLCLSCHESLSKRIASGLGLHARQGYERCERCHIEHHGRDFELIWWGEGGRDGFDHGLTGFPLAGAHAKSSCEDCHRAESIVDRPALEAAGKDLNRTFLGLDRTCLSCHEDEHRGQVAADSCASCHDLDRWSPASVFDHDRSRFHLTGLHESVACTGCHATLKSEGELEQASTLRFDVDAFGACSDCHRDPHEGRLGPSCESCHSTAGWSRLDPGAFDHERTRFALNGAHRRVACEGCHAPGAGFKVDRFEVCADCHEDDHLGQFSSSTEEEGCLACHSVDGFKPALFTLQDHQSSDYPLEGAHLAIPCIACHREVGLDELRLHVANLTVPAGLARETARQFRFQGKECDDCHGDPHEGELDRWREPAGCEGCHDLSSWRSIAFDHDSTELPLRGGHLDLLCRECHSIGLDLPKGTPLRLTGASAACSSCHEDPHWAQFAADDGSVSCERCHDESSWDEPSFDHDRDARFPLEGAHLKVSCGECHPVDTRDEHAFIRYRPIGRTCEDCHATLEQDSG